MLEWNIEAYNRKFADTLASVSVNGQPPTWRYILRIDDYGGVRERDEEAFGEVACEADGLNHRETLLPPAEFHYKPIRCGVYGSSENNRHLYLILRRHVKSYKIGLHNEAYIISRFDRVTGEWRTVNHRARIDLDNPVDMEFTKDAAILKGLLVVTRNSLKYQNEEIGFVEGNKIILKDMAFSPLLTPLLENKWEIVNLQP